jgi:Aldehyde dehydrogenase family
MRAIAFSATGTRGQVCTTMRRLIVDEEIMDRVAYMSLVRTAGASTGDIGELSSYYWVIPSSFIGKLGHLRRADGIRGRVIEINLGQPRK